MSLSERDCDRGWNKVQRESLTFNIHRGSAFSCRAVSSCPIPFLIPYAVDE